MKNNKILFCISIFSLFIYSVCFATLDRSTFLFGIISILLYSLMIIPLMYILSPSLRNENNKRIKFKNRAEAFIFHGMVYLLGGTAVYFALFSDAKHNIILSVVSLFLLLVYFVVYILVSAKRLKHHGKHKNTQ